MNLLYQVDRYAKNGPGGTLIRRLNKVREGEELIVAYGEQPAAPGDFTANRVAIIDVSMRIVAINPVTGAECIRVVGFLAGTAEWVRVLHYPRYGSVLLQA